MKTLLVLAGNMTEFNHWKKENAKMLKEEGLVPKYISQNDIRYLGHRDCFYVEVGTYWRTERNDSMYEYFSSHNIGYLR